MFEIKGSEYWKTKSQLMAAVHIFHENNNRTIGDRPRLFFSFLMY